MALGFCGGLPLALTLLHGALHGAQQAAGGSADPILQRIKASGNISCDKSDRLWELLMFSMECLSEELQNTWLDLVQGYGGLYLTSDNALWLECMFEPTHLQDLQQRNLVVFQFDKVDIAWAPDVKVAVHEVLRCMANHMCGPDSKNYHYHATGDGKISIPKFKVKSALAKDATQMPGEDCDFVTLCTCDTSLLCI
jgi:hypothetical protein